MYMHLKSSRKGQPLVPKCPCFSGTCTCEKYCTFTFTCTMNICVRYPSYTCSTYVSIDR